MKRRDFFKVLAGAGVGAVVGIPLVTSKDTVVDDHEGPRTREEILYAYIKAYRDNHELQNQLLHGTYSIQSASTRSPCTGTLRR